MACTMSETSYYLCQRWHISCHSRYVSYDKPQLTNIMWPVTFFMPRMTYISRHKFIYSCRMTSHERVISSDKWEIVWYVTNHKWMYHVTNEIFHVYRYHVLIIIWHSVWWMAYDMSDDHIIHVKCDILHVIIHKYPMSCHQ